MNISKNELYSNGISDEVNIEKTEAVDLLTGKFDFDRLVLCENFNLHYCDEPFLVKLDHFCASIVKGTCQKRNQFLNVQLVAISNILTRLFAVINNKIN